MKHVWIAGVAAVLALGGPAEAQMVQAALNADIRSTTPGVNRDDNTDAVVLHMIEGLVGYRENGSVAPLRLGDLCPRCRHVVEDLADHVS